MSNREKTFVSYHIIHHNIKRKRRPTTVPRPTVKINTLNSKEKGAIKKKKKRKKNNQKEESENKINGQLHWPPKRICAEQELEGEKEEQEVEEEEEQDIIVFFFF